MNHSSRRNFMMTLCNAIFLVTAFSVEEVPANENPLEGICRDSPDSADKAAQALPCEPTRLPLVAH